MPVIFNADSDNGIGTVANNNAEVIVRASYTNFTSGAATDVLTLTGTGVRLFFEDNGSLLSVGTGNALVASQAISVTVNAGSSLIAGGTAINMSNNGALDLVNYGLIKATGASAAILSAGDGSRIDNYGEISSSGGSAYSTVLAAGSVINNYGTFRAGSASSKALGLGNSDDVVNNHGIIFGETGLSLGDDSVFNSGTMRGSIAINGLTGFGAKTIVNNGLIATTSLGNDAIALGSGNDLIFNFGSIHGTIHLGGGADGYQSYNGATLSAGVFGEAGQDNLIGNDFTDQFNGGDDNDTLQGNGGDDTLVGGGGNDEMYGGGGDDTFFVDSQADIVNEAIAKGQDTILASASYTLAANVEVERLFNNSGVGLTLTGNEFAQTIYGHVTAADTLAGGGGADTLNGQGGNDTYNLGAFDASIVDSAGTADLVTSTVTRSLASFAGIENLTLLGAGAGNGTGNALANIVTGNNAANILDGGADAVVDSLRGLTGNDTYVLRSGNDGIIDTGGIDTITSTITRSLAAFATIENLTLLGSGNGTGNGLANIVTGSAAANTLDGGLANDTLKGLAGNDILIGNLGKDTSTGGVGNDIFRFASKTHSVVGANADVITDFDDSGNDTIDVSALFGPLMTYRHNLAFTAAGQVRINDIAGADVIVEVNTGGSLAADFALRLTATTLASMTAGDFFL